MSGKTEMAGEGPTDSSARSNNHDAHKGQVWPALAAVKYSGLERGSSHRRLHRHGASPVK